MASSFWTERFVTADGTYTCPWCAKPLKAKISQSPKNPGKAFVSCNKDYGGCNMFSWLEAEPNEDYKPQGEQPVVKKAKSAAANVVTKVLGPVTKKPNLMEERVGE